jgi:hypothetical protein
MMFLLIYRRAHGLPHLGRFCPWAASAWATSCMGVMCARAVCGWAFWMGRAEEFSFPFIAIWN